jgi:hypothetical protein
LPCHTDLLEAIRLLSLTPKPGAAMGSVTCSTVMCYCYINAHTSCTPILQFLHCGAQQSTTQSCAAQHSTATKTATCCPLKTAHSTERCAIHVLPPLWTGRSCAAMHDRMLLRGHTMSCTFDAAHSCAQAFASLMRCTHADYAAAMLCCTCVVCLQVLHVVPHSDCGRLGRSA